MVRKIIWLVFAIGISGAFIYGFEAFLLEDYNAFLSSFVGTVQNTSSEVQDKIDPIFEGIMTIASFAAKGFAALIGITIANLIFRR